MLDRIRWIGLRSGIRWIEVWWVERGGFYLDIILARIICLRKQMRGVGGSHAGVIVTHDGLAGIMVCQRFL